MLAKIVKTFSEMALNNRHDGICDGNFETLEACAFQKTLDYNPWTSLWSHQKEGHHGHGLMPFVWNMALHVHKMLPSRPHINHVKPHASVSTWS